MTLVSDDNSSSRWSLISSNFFLSYWIVAFSAIAIYDWALTSGQEVELVWKQRWSLMTILYLIVRYIEIPYIVLIGNIPGETVLFGTYQCIIILEEDVALLIAMIWTLTAAWEILALCLAVWIAVKHFRELRQMPAGRGIIKDSFTVLIQTHLIYFASFFTVSCLSLLASFVEAETYGGLRQIFLVMQMFVLGPRLIFNVRKFHAKLVASSDEGTSMTSIAFQERIRVSTSGNV
ncbi:uncharacterized protein F5147DRAFT_838502 [Suillus discolor]|uniref:DUF6533 domain-containing protein n=1 Tax=Suillus discolor TaxID=1912936 RepID=A0A9P7F3N7_9AGAM|nr:uncharacterized protein F5147DRAFT_838502 [Suillus discolor]KAG2103385.1 hypothetical protein F5147DRAFT_838502 [Suillus discolor]